MLYNCNRCDGSSTALLVRLLNHIGRCQSNEPGIHVLCGIEECAITYTNYANKHHFTIMEREGRISITENRQEEEAENLVNEEEYKEEFNMEREQQQLMGNNALCLMEIEEGKSTQTNLDNVVDQATQIVCKSIDMVKNAVAEKLHLE